MASSSLALLGWSSLSTAENKMAFNRRGTERPISRRGNSSETHWHSGQELLEVVPGHRLAFGDEKAGFAHHCLQDVVQQFVAQPAGGADRE